ncbi:linear amide C-N hydrolase [Thiotrichales bacterium 19S3-7]|nr:linear amide C-N hydrolase [Thiotrichales bacterium 19S3-7]MCF6801227.1 linear amide C-N hydrolase [Thiotrichales bacterium 19S3-11]
MINHNKAKCILNVFLFIFLSLFIIFKELHACSNIFLYDKNYVIEARTLDFPVELLDRNNQAYSWYAKIPIYQAAITQLLNHAFSYKKGYINSTQISNVIINNNNIPITKLAHWTNKYGYFGRTGFIGNNILDGMNTQGLSVSAMFHPGSTYPKYNQSDSRPALSVYDTSDFVLGNASTTEEAITLLKQYQIVESSLKAIDGIFVKDIPLHLSIRDAHGNSAVIEFIHGEVAIYSIGDVLTNAPSYKLQVQNTLFYKKLLNYKPYSKKPSNNQSNSIINQKSDYSYIKQPEFPVLLILPEGTSSKERFIRANALLNHLPQVLTNQDAMYQAQLVIEKLTVPDEVTSETLWITFKDLKHRKLYYKDLYNYANRTAIPEAVSNQAQVFDLNTMDFELKLVNHPKKNLYHNERIKAIYSLYDIPGIKSYFIYDQFAHND